MAWPDTSVSRTSSRPRSRRDSARTNATSARHLARYGPNRGLTPAALTRHALSEDDMQINVTLQMAMNCIVLSSLVFAGCAVGPASAQTAPPALVSAVGPAS